MTASAQIALVGGHVLRRTAGRWAPEQATLVIEGSQVLEVRDPSKPLPSARPVDVSGRLLVPGFVNAHYHSADQLFRGSLEKGPLELWLMPWSVLGDVEDEDILAGVHWAASELAAAGFTTVLDHFAPARSAQLVVRAAEGYASRGVQATVAPLIGDRGYDEVPPLGKPQPGASPEETEDLLQCARDVIVAEKARSGTTTLGPAAPQRCTRHLLTGLSALAKEHDANLHLHCLETALHQTTASELWGMSTVGYLESLGVLGPHVSLAHCVWITDEEIDTLARTRTAVVHVPISNGWLGSGIAPVRKLVDAGVTVALGSDGYEASGPADAFSLLRAALVASRLNTPDPSMWLTPQQVLDMLWEGGRRIFPEADVGRLEPGARADVVVIDTSHAAFRPKRCVAEQLVLYADRTAVDAVFSGGGMLWRRDTHTTPGPSLTMQQLEAAATRTQDRIPDADAGKREHVLEAYAAILTAEGSSTS